MPPRKRPSIDPLIREWQTTCGTGVLAELAVAQQHWHATEPSAATRARIGAIHTQFAAWVTSKGRRTLLDVTAADCDEFIAATTRRQRRPAAATMHLRRTALRDLYAAVEHLEPDLDDPTRKLAAPPKKARRIRPLTDHELDRLRTTAAGRPRTGTRRAMLAVALAEATATTGEIPTLRWRHVDFDHGRIQLPGAKSIQARTSALRDQVRAVLELYRGRPGDLIMATRPSSYHSGQAATTNLLSRLIGLAGISDPQVAPGSIRLHAGRRILRSDGIEAAARALGYTSLDTTAEALDHHWQAPT